MVKKGLLTRGARREKELGLAEGLFRIESSAFFILGGETGLSLPSGVLVLETQTLKLQETSNNFLCLLLNFGRSAPGLCMLFF